MLHSIQYSIIQHLRTQLPELTNVVWVYNGVSLKKEKSPFATVENLITNVRVLDKLQEYEADTYNFQVGVFNDKNGDNIKLAEKVKSVLMKAPVQLYDTTLEEVIGTFRVTVGNITPIAPASIEDETGKNRRYLDITVFSLQKI